jgi:hypothetical protein
MKQNITTLLFALTIKFTCHSQECDCISNFNWVVETFRTNDAGYQMATLDQGQGFDDAITETCRKEAERTSTKKECAEIMLEWLHSFRPQHLGVQLLKQDVTTTELQAKNVDIANWETVELDIEAFKSKVLSGNAKMIEGIWQSDPYTIAIVSTESGYHGIVIEAGNSGWKKGEVKIRIQADGMHGIYYSKDRSERAISQIEYIGTSHIRFNQLLFERKFPTTTIDPNVEHYINASSSKKPYLDVVNHETLLLRIPSFEYSEKNLIDSIIVRNESKIQNYPNLIIDLTNNGGGSDESFESLLPLIYTGTIRTIQTAYYSTPFNIQEFKDYLQMPDLKEDDRKMLTDAVAKLDTHPYSFVTLTDSITDYVQDSLILYPKQVAILINEGCASTTEQFLLSAKQSRKVKLYGRNTMGVLDISNMKTVESPCHEYALSYSWTRSLRLPDYPIDDIGIQPDFFLDNTVPHSQWIGYVAKKMAEG